MQFSALETSVWKRLAEETRPIVLYGMGDGADKILTQFVRSGIQAAGVFASDEFVRGQTFHDFRVKKLQEIIREFGNDIVIVICFASQRPDVLEKMYDLDTRFDVVAPDVPVVEGALFDEHFVQMHQAEMERAFALLADERSKEVFLDTIRFKLSGKLQYLRRSESGKEEVFEKILCLSAQEAFVDLGAYNGDTIRELLHYTGGKYHSIAAMEPDRRNFRKLSEYARQNLQGDVTLLQTGAWSEDTVLTFAAQAGRQSKVAKHGVETVMRAVDSVLDGKCCTLLKMDVEGAERQAIAGAEQTIRTFHPKLNIAAYHTSEDFFALPLLLHTICPSYRFYLRHHPYVPAWDTNLYAVCP